MPSGSAGGLAAVRCPSCNAGFLTPVPGLTRATSVTCPKCSGQVDVATAERADPALARVLGVLREQQRMRRA
jgi:uncharacterized paraquat-inducible protein A